MHIYSVQPTLPKTPSVEEQQQNLQSPDEGVRFGAARGLWLKGPKAKEAIPDLINALEDQTAKVRGYAARALAKMGPDAKGAVPVLTELLGDQAEYSIATWVDTGGFGRPAKRQMYVRANAAEALGSIGPDAQTAIPTLLELLQDSQADVRKAAADALGNLGPASKEAVPALTALLSDKESAVRGPAARALGRIGPEAKPAALALAKLLDDKTKYEEGVNLVYGLGRPLEEFAKTLCVRDNAVTALLRIGPEATLPTLRELLGDEEAEARSAAAKGLGLFGPKAKTAVPDLIATLRDESWQVRHSATEALGAVGPEAKAAVPDLVGLLLEENQEDGDAAPIERMQRALDLRHSVAEALRKMLPDATDSLTRMLRDKDNRVRGTTAYVVGEIGQQAKATIPDLTELLQDEDHQVRIAAVWALGKMGADAKDAMSDLKDLLENESEQLREAAAEALKAIEPREE